MQAVAVAARHYGRRAAAYLRPKRHAGAMPTLTKVTELRHPRGVVGQIAPWNYPLELSVGDALPAFVAGNAVVMKPDTETCLTALWARDLLIEAGLPADVFQVVLGEGPVVGPEVVRHADYVSFTGSTRTGREVARGAAARLVGVSLELGGKNAMLVLEDADLDKAAAGAVRACFSSAGQLCISIERLYVHESVADAFLERFSTRTRAIRLGASLAYGAGMGSLVGQRQLDAVTRHVDDAVAKGAKVLAGGAARPDIGPYFYEPTILDGVEAPMSVCSEETFGPVVSVYRFSSDDEAVERANSHPVRSELLRLDQGRPPRPRDRRPAAHRHGQHQRGLRTRVRQRPVADGRHEGLRPRPPARLRGHPQVHRGPDRRPPAPAPDGPVTGHGRREVRGLHEPQPAPDEGVPFPLGPGPRRRRFRRGEHVSQENSAPGPDDGSGHDYDVIVVGSGFGGSVSALRLTEKGYRVAVLEAGRRFTRETLPKNSWDLKNYLWAPKLGMYGIQRIHLLGNVMVLAGAGVGGGSLNYANTLYVPPKPFFEDPQWGHITDWQEELARTTTRPGACSAYGSTRRRPRRTCT
ncbi:hypothetical protein GCM10023238_18780 [Streptomyces heliomycini]